MIDYIRGILTEKEISFAAVEAHGEADEGDQSADEHEWVNP